MFKHKLSFQNLLIVFLSLILIAISTFSLIRILFFPENFQITTLEKIISIITFIYILIFSSSGILSYFFKSKKKTFLKIFSIGLISLFIFFPFLVFLQIYVSIIFYIISTIGMFLYQKNK